jgi:hypothetical protein
MPTIAIDNPIKIESVLKNTLSSNTSKSFSFVQKQIKKDATARSNIFKTLVI